MTDEFRRLGEVLEPISAAALPFAPEVKAASRWVDNLPRADVTATRKQLQAALDTLASAYSKGSQRFELAEALRQSVADTADLVTRQYANRSLPLPMELQALPEATMRLHLRLADIYRIAAADLCAPSGTLPWLKASVVPEALGRALHHYAEAMWVAWRVYANFPSKAWRGVHRCARFAEGLQLLDKPVKDPFGDTRTLKASYLRLCLMGVLGPTRFSSADQDRIWQIASQFASACELLAAAEPRAIPIGIDDDAPPSGRAAGDRWLDVTPFSGAVDRALGSAKGDVVAFGATLANTQPVAVELLVKLQRAFTQATQRTHARLPGGHGMETVVGLQGLHFQLADERDFETLAREVLPDQLLPEVRGDWQRTQGDAAQRAPRIKAEVLDQSLGGYRVTWAEAGQSRIRVGELVGLTADEGVDAFWIAGLVRWVRYEPDGRLYAGVELLSREVRAVVLGYPGRTPLRALEMRPLDDAGDWIYLTSQRLALSEQWPTLGRDMPDAEAWVDARPTGTLEGLLSSGAIGDYFLYTLPSPLVGTAALDSKA